MMHVINLGFHYPLIGFWGVFGSCFLFCSYLCVNEILILHNSYYSCCLSLFWFCSIFSVFCSSYFFPYIATMKRSMALAF